LRRREVGEVSQRVANLSETEVVRECHRALVALYPTLRRLDCLEDDTQPYDDYDRVAACLWQVLVERSLMWKYGLDAPPRLPPYGFSCWEGPTDGYVRVVTEQPAGAFRFVRFIGDRQFGQDPFNAVTALDKMGAVLTVALARCQEFSWVRG
jgi:hypothetical protein